MCLSNNAPLSTKQTLSNANHLTLQLHMQIPSTPQLQMRIIPSTQLVANPSSFSLPTITASKSQSIPIVPPVIPVA